MNEREIRERGKRERERECVSERKKRERERERREREHCVWGGVCALRVCVFEKGKENRRDRNVIKYKCNVCCVRFVLFCFCFALAFSFMSLTRKK